MRHHGLACLAAAALAALCGTAHADVSIFVDNYKTNLTANTTTDNNAALFLLQGYSSLWTTGSDWSTGTPTALGASTLAASQAYVVNVTGARTPAQELSAYLVDRRNQSFSAISGLGSLSGAYASAAGATTTILALDPLAYSAKFDDRGTGSGSTASASVGQIVTLVNTLRGSFSSTTPAKNYFNSPRPWRVNDAGTVAATGTETIGYITSTLADGTPNLAAALTYFPSYASNVSVAPSLLAVRSTTPASDGGFASGHTNAAYLASWALAYAMPGQMQGLLANAAQMGEDRIVAGMHTPLDVMGGRVLGTALSAAILNDSANAALKAAALAQGQAFVAANAAAADRFSGLDAAALQANRQAADLYRSRMSYGLPTSAATGVAASVPKGAEVLIETRFAYLDAAQRREVLRTTAINSGNALLDDAEGWGRLDLYAAADGYGRFDGTTTVNLPSGRDAWRNDIGGAAGLVKQGAGELALSGANSFAGGVRVEAGSLVAASTGALGLGGVQVGTGAKLVDFAPGHLALGGDLSLADGSQLEMVLAGVGTGSSIIVAGDVVLDGVLVINALDGSAGAWASGGTFRLVEAGGAVSGSFDAVLLTGLASSWQANLVYAADGVSVQISAVPEPATWALWLAAAAGAAVRRRGLRRPRFSSRG